MDTWRGTVFGLVFLRFSLPIVFYLLTHPGLLWRRIHAGGCRERMATGKQFADVDGLTKTFGQIGNAQHPGVATAGFCDDADTMPA